MANSKIHIFNAHNGTFLRTLTGHELGVWCLTLVSAAKETGPPVEEGRFSPEGASSGDVFDDDIEQGGSSKGKKRRVTSWRTGPDGIKDLPNYPFKFNPGGSGFNSRSGRCGSQENGDCGQSSRMDDGHEDALPRARRMQQSDVCGAAQGWGQKDAIIISGGCDRDVKVWNVTTG
jgi:WD40 repeat protein